MSEISTKAKALNRILAKKLRDWRNEKSLTMRALSQVIGTPHSFIGKLEMQDRRLDVAEFVLYCEGMDKDPRSAFDEYLRAIDR